MHKNTEAANWDARVDCSLALTKKGVTFKRLSQALSSLSWHFPRPHSLLFGSLISTNFTSLQDRVRGSAHFLCCWESLENWAYTGLKAGHQAFQQ